MVDTVAMIRVMRKILNGLPLVRLSRPVVTVRKVPWSFRFLDTTDGTIPVYDRLIAEHVAKIHAREIKEQRGW